MFRRCFAVSIFCVVSGCLPAPKAAPPAPVNAGVNIVPTAVLASQKMTPSSQPSRIDEPDLVEVLQRSDQSHRQLIDLIRNSGLVTTLQAIGPYTIFAPTDDAFGKLPPGVLDNLLLPEHHTALVQFVKYHLFKGRISMSDLQQCNGQVTTLAGPIVIVKGIDSKVMVNDANVIRTDTAASNGIIQWVDGVLIPPS